MSSPPLKQSPLVAGSPPGTKSPLASSPPGTKSPLASSPPGTKSPLASSPPGTKSPLASEAGSPTGTKSPGSPPGPKSIPKSPEEMRLKKETRLARLQRQASKDSQGPRLKSVGSGGSLFRPRMDSTSSACRRPSLGFGHSNSIPFHLDASSLHDIDLEEVPWWTSKRLLLSFTCFVGFFFLYSLRVNLSTAIVCMTKEIVDPKIVNGSIVYDINNSTNSTNTTLTVTESKLTGYDDEGCPIMSGGRKLEGEFEWSKGLQGLVLGAFFWGYTLMQIPSGFLSDRFGARLTIACGMFPVALLTIISPFLARGSPYLLLVGRALIGMGEAMMYPGMQSLWSKWSPPHERSRLVGFAFGGSQLGNALTFPFAGLLCAYGFDGGWPSVFYVTGMLAFIWCVAYVLYTRDSPGQMNSITAIERKYIEQSLGTYGQSVEERLAQRVVPWWTSKRLLLSFTCFVGFFFLYSLRVNLSTAIVCMTKEIVDPKIVNGSIVYDINNSTNSTNTTLTVTESKLTGYDDEGCPIMSGGRKLEGEFEWSKGLQGLVLGAFFWGYTLMQIPSGFLSDRFGARLTIACGMFPVALLTIISPFLARGSPYLLLVGRALIGMGEAMMYPGMQSLWSKWSPPHERSRLVGFAFGGSQLGNALTFPFAGLLCAYGFDGGWPSVFYVTGMLAFIWCVAYVLYTRDSPGQMNSITAIERKYIEQSLGTYGQSVEERLAQRKKEKPWKKIFTSGPVWAILIANACGNYGAYMLLTQMPTYMKEVLKFDIKSNGAFSMIPYLAFWLFIILGGQIADVIISKEILSTTVTRKVCCCLGTVVPAIFLVATGFMDCMNQVGAVVLLSLSMAFCGFQFSSFFINHGDIAPKYAGTVFGFTNTGASIPGILAPYVVGAITKNKTKEEWRLAFYIAAAIYVFGAVMYCILAKGEVLDWAKEEVEHDIREDFPLHEITEENDEEENEKDKMINGEKAGVVFE